MKDIVERLDEAAMSGVGQSLQSLCFEASAMIRSFRSGQKLGDEQHDRLVGRLQEAESKLSRCTALLAEMAWYEDEIGAKAVEAQKLLTELRIDWEALATMSEERCKHPSWIALEGGGWQCMSCDYVISYDPRLAIDQVIKVTNERDRARAALGEMSAAFTRRDNKATALESRLAEIERHAENATEYVLAQINRDLKGQLEAAEQHVKILNEQCEGYGSRFDTIQSAAMRSRLFKLFFEQHFWHAHHVDLVWRYNGEDHREEADWIKDIWYALLPIKEVEQDGDETLVYLEGGELLQDNPPIGLAEAPTGEEPTNPNDISSGLVDGGAADWSAGIDQYRPELCDECEYPVGSGTPGCRTCARVGEDQEHKA